MDVIIIGYTALGGFYGDLVMNLNQKLPAVMCHVNSGLPLKKALEACLKKAY